jgi:hypothetical protein
MYNFEARETYIKETLELPKTELIDCDGDKVNVVMLDNSSIESTAFDIYMYDKAQLLKLGKFIVDNLSNDGE